MMTTAQSDRIGISGQVSQIPLPPEARALSTLARIDYADAFIVDAGRDRTAEQWVRAVFNGAPLTVRTRLVTGWLGLGLKLGPPWSPGRVLGWKVAHTSPTVVRLAADSLVGLRAELLFCADPGGLLFATLIQQTNPAARAVWLRVTPTHQKVVHSLLRHAAGRARSSTRV